MRHALSARTLCWFFAAALTGSSLALADDAPPERREQRSPAAPATNGSQEPDEGRDAAREAPASALGFELPPVLEELMDRLEDGLRQGVDATGNPPTATRESPAASRTEQAAPGSADADQPSDDTDDQPTELDAEVRGVDTDESEREPRGDGSDSSDSDAALVEAEDVGTAATTANAGENSESTTSPPGDAEEVETVVGPTTPVVPGPAPGAPDDPGLWGPPPPDPAANEFGTVPISLLGSEIKPGSRERLHWTTGQSFSGSVMETPVVVVHGQRRGPRLCLTGGVHGDELNGIEVVRRVAYRVEPQLLAGTVIAVPIVNLLGFSRGSRYLPDRRDLNRFFPGSLHGSSASRIANSFFESIIIHCDALVDVHTGSLDRANLPQVRGDLTNPAVLEFTRGFGATAVLHSPGSMGMLRHAASVRGIPSVTFEIGAPLRLQPEEIEHGVQAIETLLNKMGMIEQRRRWREPQAVFYESRWVRVDHGGMLFSDVALGDRVQRGQRLGRVIDPVSNRAADVVSNDAGRIIGMALNQLVLPGFAAYNLGIAASEEQVVTEAALDAAPDDERFLENDQLDEDQRLLEDGDRVPDEAMENARRREGDSGRH